MVSAEFNTSSVAGLKFVRFPLSGLAEESETPLLAT
jgi:hypothetical protein